MQFIYQTINKEA